MKLYPSVDPDLVVHAESIAESIELLWRCRTLAKERQTLANTHPGRHQQQDTGVATMVTAAATQDMQLMGAEITFGTTLIGHVEGLIRDPISQRVRRLITSYGLAGRRVGVPMEWIINRSPSRLELGVSARSLDDLSDWARA
jgi:hypothetical protein